LEFWYSSGDATAYKFLMEFYEYFIEFGDSIELKPHIVTWFDSASRENNFTEVVADCYSGGRYCAPDPDGGGPANGSMVVHQDLVQLCVYNTLGFGDWLHYMNLFHTFCADKWEKTDCYAAVLGLTLTLKPKGMEVMQCVAKVVGKNETLEDIDVLAEEREYFQHSDIAYWPSLQINHAPFKGSLFPVEEAAEAICEILTPGHPACIDFNPTIEIESDMETWEAVAIIFVAVLIFLIGAWIFYKIVMKRQLKEQVNLQLQQVIHDYAAFVDKKNYKFSNT